MSDVVQINNHISEALNRRMEQWRGKPNMESVLTALLVGVQEIEQTFFDLMEKRLDINAAEGEQLDQFGLIVGQDRLGFEDGFYRILLLARIGINISNGEPERIIDTAKILTSAQFIHYMNLNDAQMAIGSDGTVDTLTVDFLLRNLERVIPGGRRVNYLCIYDPDEAFSMAGNNTKTVGKGFGTVADANVGGKFGECYTVKNKFSFDGNNTQDSGFGTIADPLVGGVLE